MHLRLFCGFLKMRGILAFYVFVRCRLGRWYDGDGDAVGWVGFFIIGIAAAGSYRLIHNAGYLDVFRGYEGCVVGLFPTKYHS